MGVAWCVWQWRGVGLCSGGVFLFSVFVSAIVSAAECSAARGYNNMASSVRDAALCGPEPDDDRRHDALDCATPFPFSFSGFIPTATPHHHQVLGAHLRSLLKGGITPCHATVSLVAWYCPPVTRMQRLRHGRASHGQPQHRLPPLD